MFKLHQSKHKGIFFFSLDNFYTDGGFPTAHSTTTNPTEYSQLQQDEGRTKATTEQSLKSQDQKNQSNSWREREQVACISNSTTGRELRIKY